MARQRREERRALMTELFSLGSQVQVAVRNPVLSYASRTISVDKALLREMMKKTSRHGSIDPILNEALTVFYNSEKKKGFKRNLASRIYLIDFYFRSLFLT